MASIPALGKSAQVFFRRSGRHSESNYGTLTVPELWTLAAMLVLPRNGSHLSPREFQGSQCCVLLTGASRRFRVGRGCCLPGTDGPTPSREVLPGARRPATRRAHVL